MTRKKTRLGILALAVLATGSWLLTREADTPDRRPLSGLDTHLNYALHNFEGVLLDDMGKISVQIQSPALRKDAASEVGTIEQPIVRINHEGDEWYIEAESAIITADREHVFLKGYVNMLRTHSVSGQTLEITTQDVMLEITPRTASTEALVTLVQSGDRLDAVGMNLDMKTDSYELLNEVRARYETR